ncbi:uncharacterized protein LOC110066128 [Orbicella faveolata]|uniref:uncharacterized protein LOC110066128 n=1 Tax=Orbicella faveolata TaxID=48498 RepID=UPI0009E51109|nr:uncharacterized protein LOC110066128 [Orbicella faveolata]
MIPQGITHFRFRSSVVLILVFLLTSPTQVSSEAKSCAAVTLAWNGFEAKLPLGKDPQFVRNLADCLNEVKKPDSEIRGIIQQLPEVIDKVLPVARTDGLVLLSMYFFYKSYLLYDEAKILEVNAMIYRDKFEALEKEMKPFRNFIDTELIPQWEAGNTANLEKIAEELLKKIGRHSVRLQELTQAIRQDIKTGGSNQRWSPYVAAGGFFLCLGSVIVRPAPNVATPPSSGVLGDASFSGVSIPICIVAIGTAGYSWLSYSSLSDSTLPELERLEKDATTMGQEITRYQSQLKLISLK